MPGRTQSAAVAVNCNATFKPHCDSGAGQGQGLSLIVGLGDYLGGELIVEGVPHDIRYNPIEFDGWNERHWTRPFTGERYSLVWFTPMGCGEGKENLLNCFDERGKIISDVDPKTTLHIKRFVEWLRKQCHQNDSRQNDILTPVDPVSKCKELKGHKYSKRASLDLEAGSSESFQFHIDGIIGSLQNAAPFLNTERGSTKGEVASTMYSRLANALRYGEPADFSNQEELLVYTVGRMRDRSRYVFAIAMESSLKVCSKIRRLFLPAAGGTSRVDPIKVCSVGGAAGFDHFALVALSAFLTRVQPIQQDEYTWKPAAVKTTVFDLYAQHWRPVLKLMTSQKDATTSGSSVEIEPCDIRQDLAAPCNKMMAASVSEADLILFQFVLHENAAYLRVDKGNSSSMLADVGEDEKFTYEISGAAAASGQRIGGSVIGILQSAKLGTIMLCTDAGKRLWPALAATGRDHGWSTTHFKRVRNGPKSFSFVGGDDDANPCVASAGGLWGAGLRSLYQELNENTEYRCIAVEHHQDMKARETENENINEKSDIGGKTTTKVVELSDNNNMYAESTSKSVSSDDIAKLPKTDDQMKENAAKWWDQEDGGSNENSSAPDFGGDREESGETDEAKPVEPQPKEDTHVPASENNMLETDTESQILDDGSANVRSWRMTRDDDTTVGIANVSEAGENLESPTPSQPDTSLLDGALDEVDDEPQDLVERHTSVIL
eukprot:g3481.t1